MRAPSPAFTDGAGFAAADGFCGVVAFDFAVARTSVSVTRPSGPVPLTLARSTPSSTATRRATGEAFTRASSPFSIFGAGFSASACFSALGAAPCFSSFFSAGFASAFFSSFFSVFASAGASSFFASFFSSFFSSADASSPSPLMKAILSPTFTLPPSSTCRRRLPCRLLRHKPR